MKFLLLVIFIPGLAACISLPVAGEYHESGEMFIGSATGYIHGRGNVAIRSEQGTRCYGTFRLFSVLNQSGGGDGGFHCADGRTGDFYFIWNGTEGAAFGRDDHGRLFRFHFGDSEYTHPSWPALSAEFDRLTRSHRPSTDYCTEHATAFRCTHHEN